MAKLLTRVMGTLVPGVYAAVIILLTSCVGSGVSSQHLAELSLGNERPTHYALLYYPYSVSLTHIAAMPHPLYSGWPQHRMRQDLRRIRETGTDLLLLHTDAAKVLQDRDLAQLYTAFIGYAAEAGVDCALYLDCEKLDDGQATALVQWLLALNLNNASAYWKDAGRPIVVLVNAAEIEQIRHIGFDFRRWEWQPASRLARVSGLSMPMLADQGRVLRVRAGWIRNGASSPDDVKWAVKRRNGDTIFEAVTVGARLNPRILVVDSWNDYAHGSFVEPNSLDQEQALMRLREAIRDARTPIAETP